MDATAMQEKFGKALMRTNTEKAGRRPSKSGFFASSGSFFSDLTYASRMQYLRDDNITTADTLFLTRKAAQRRVDPPISLSAKLPSLIPNAKAPTGAQNRMLQRRSLQSNRGAGEWVKKFQAGCHFWQHSVSGECVEQDPNQMESESDSDSEQEVEFPDAFKFLDE